MATAKYYSPRVDRDLISPLYHAAKCRRVPMTRLASALIREALDRLIDSGDALIAAIRSHPPGSQATLLVKNSAGAARQVQVTLGSQEVGTR